MEWHLFSYMHALRAVTWHFTGKAEFYLWFNTAVHCLLTLSPTFTFRTLTLSSPLGIRVQCTKRGLKLVISDTCEAAISTSSWQSYWLPWRPIAKEWNWFSTNSPRLFGPKTCSVDTARWAADRIEFSAGIPKEALKCFAYKEMLYRVHTACHNQYICYRLRKPGAYEPLRSWENPQVQTHCTFKCLYNSVLNFMHLHM